MSKTISAVTFTSYESGLIDIRIKQELVPYNDTVAVSKLCNEIVLSYNEKQTAIEYDKKHTQLLTRIAGKEADKNLINRLDNCKTREQLYEVLEDYVDVNNVNHGLDLILDLLLTK
jgi:hypothetical protein